MTNRQRQGSQPKPIPCVLFVRDFNEHFTSRNFSVSCHRGGLLLSRAPVNTVEDKGTTRTPVATGNRGDPVLTNTQATVQSTPGARHSLKHAKYTKRSANLSIRYRTVKSYNSEPYHFGPDFVTQATANHPATNPSLNIEPNQHLGVELLSPLLHPVRDGPLPGPSALCESSAATKRPSSGPVADADDANIVHASNGRIASHTSRHLHLEREVLVGRQAQPLKPHTRNILCHLGSLERRRVRTTGRPINGSSKGAGPILVNLCLPPQSVTDSPTNRGNQPKPGSTQTHLVKRHCDSPIIRTRWQPGASTLASRSSNSALSLDRAGGATTAKQALKSLQELPGNEPESSLPLLRLSLAPRATQSTDVILDADPRVRRVHLGRGTGAHEVGDHRGRVDGAVALGATQRADSAGPDLPVADDGCVGLRAAAVAGAVAGGAVGDWEWEG